MTLKILSRPPDCLNVSLKFPPILATMSDVSEKKNVITLNVMIANLLLEGLFKLRIMYPKF